jgi:hypothetical protein
LVLCRFAHFPMMRCLRLSVRVYAAFRRVFLCP